MSRSASTGSRTSIGVSGLTAQAAFFPSARMWSTVLRRSGTASTWTLMRFRNRLDVDVDEVRARAREVFEEAVGLHDHQVQVERHLRPLADRLHHRRTDGDVGDELPVHHVDVEHVGPRELDRLHLFSQACEIGGEDGRGDAEGSRH